MDDLEEKFDKSKNELTEKLEKHVKKRTLVNMLSTLSITAAIIPMFFLIIKLFGGDFTLEDSSQLYEDKLLQKIRLRDEVVKRQIDSMTLVANQFKIFVDSIDVKPNQDQVKLQKLQTQVHFQDIQIKNLNSIILENPEKAIAIPMLKLKMDNWDKQYEKDTKSIKEEIARVYDMNKWIIGLVFTMLVSLVALNISNLFTKSKKE